ncbi:hypothetical protein Ancab_035087 [Ancistrocladus abbreviatus]
MTVEDAAADPFPIGLRVLVVDDDPTCLKLMETLLDKCKYNVTVTNQAVKALNMLRENKGKFDLVISDVHMPDMDGFKLLEHVGLEMDLPVIMLSANGDPKLVMEGVRHGAVDYLLKPVRIQELQNIWQHVVRKNKMPDQEKAGGGAGESGNGSTSTANTNQDEKLNRKRKDQSSDDEENGSEGNVCENEDPATQKKQRVVWSKELHEKFVDAFTQLGPEKAFPKKILDLMNVEGITRENVASHLQKYRLFLKRLHAPPSQPTIMASALGSRDYLDGYGAFHTLGGLAKYRAATPLLSSYQPGGMLGRLNTAAGLSLRGIPPSTLIQTAHTSNTDNSLNTLARFLPVALSANQKQPVGLAASQTATNVLSGFPLQQLDQLQQNKGGIIPMNARAALDLGSSGTPNGSTNSSFAGPSSNSLALNGSQSSYSMSSANFEPVGAIGASGSIFRDYHKLNGNWPGALQSPILPANLSDSISAVSAANIQNDQLDNAFARAMSSLVGGQNVDHREPPRCHDHNLNTSNIVTAGTSNSLLPLNQSLGQNGAASANTRNFDVSSIGWSNVAPHSTFTLRNNVVQNSDSNLKMRFDDNYLLEEANILSRFTQNNSESLEDIVGGIFKQGTGETASLGGEYGLDDAFPF